MCHCPSRVPQRGSCSSHVENIVRAVGWVCPHWGGLDRITKVEANSAKRIREGLWHCDICKKQFNV